ncbi:MAG: DUF995 domain-containing protein [Trichlorobacter sp.]|jgi:hypothetical protein|nr:DUF995 domain-containing protein [Trichlorobacter sp.]
MKKLFNLCFAALLVFMVAGCAVTDEARLRDSGAMLLSANEVRSTFVGNTVVTTDGMNYYFDRGGVAIAKGAYGDASKGNWNITSEGLLCLTNWNSNYAPSECYKLFFDNVSQQRKVVDMNGKTKFTVLNILTGNPNNF